MNIENIKNKQILIQNSYHPTPHLETELEIIEQLISQNNTVYFVQCNSNLKSCFANPLNNNLTCLNCVSRIDNSLKYLSKFIDNNKLKIIDYNFFKDLSITQYYNDNYFSDLNGLRDFIYKDYDIGLAVVSSLVSYSNDHQPNLSLHKKMIDDLLISGKFLYDFFENLINFQSFDFVFLFNGRFNENRPLLRVCQKHKINYFTHERGGLLNKYLLRYNDIPHSLYASETEINSIWGFAKSDRDLVGKAFFEKRLNRIEESWYSFTKNQVKGQLPNGFDESKINITIFNSSLDEYEGLEGFGCFFYKDDNEGIDLICKSLKGKKNINIYLRVHPNLSNVTNTQTKFIDGLKSYENLIIIGATESIDTYELIIKSDLIITFGSTVGVEAAYLNKKVLLLAKCVYQNLDCVYIPKSHDELVEILLGNKVDCFADVNFNSAIKYGYWQEKMGIFYKYYNPINISKGYYRGKHLTSNFYLNYLEKTNNQIINFINKVF